MGVTAKGEPVPMTAPPQERDHSTTSPEPTLAVRFDEKVGQTWLGEAASEPGVMGHAELSPR